MEFLKALLISAVMLVNPLLVPPDLRPNYQPTINKQLASVKPVVIENPINAANLILKINQKRSEEKLLPLITNSKLSAAAEKKINSYAESKKWEMPSGEMDNLLTNSGYSRDNSWIAMTRDFNDLDSVVRGILNDEATKDTILTKTGKDIGAAVRFVSSPYKHLVGVVITATPEIQPVAVQPTQKQQAVVPTSNKGSCVGPDNKVMSLTQKECEDFNKAWGKANNWTPAGGVVTIDCLLFDGHHILSDPQTCEDFNNRKVNPEANQNNNVQAQQSQYQAPQTFSCTISYPCSGNSYTYQLTAANCTIYQNLARDMCTSNSQPVTIPPMPKYEEYKPTYPTVSTSDFNQKWPKVDTTIKRPVDECYTTGPFGDTIVCEPY